MSQQLVVAIYRFKSIAKERVTRGVMVQLLNFSRLKPSCNTLRNDTMGHFSYILFKFSIELEWRNSNT